MTCFNKNLQQADLSGSGPGVEQKKANAITYRNTSRRK